MALPEMTYLCTSTATILNCVPVVYQVHLLTIFTTLLFCKYTSLTVTAAINYFSFTCICRSLPSQTPHRDIYGLIHLFIYLFYHQPVSQ